MEDLGEVGVLAHPVAAAADVDDMAVMQQAIDFVHALMGCPELVPLHSGNTPPRHPLGPPWAGEPPSCGTVIGEQHAGMIVGRAGESIQRHHLWVKRTSTLGRPGDGLRSSGGISLRRPQTRLDSRVSSRVSCGGARIEVESIK